MNPVTVTAAAKDQPHSLIGLSKNPDYGYIRVTQNRPIIDDQGWVKNKTLSALLLGTVEDLKSLNLEIGQQIPGKLVVREQLEPFNEKDADRHMKIAGETGIPCCYEGLPIYRNVFYSSKREAEDFLVPHTNSEEIKAERLRRNDPNRNLAPGNSMLSTARL